MARRGRARRADAERQARAAKAARDAERQQRERQIEAALADYYEARARVEGIREAARARADAALADGKRAAAEPAAAVNAAIRTLRDLCDTNAEVAELCGLTLAEVRERLAAARAAGHGEEDATVPGQSPRSGLGTGSTTAGGMAAPAAGRQEVDPPSL
jgi:hypothetical protein